MTQQTAVDWLIEQIKYIDKETYATLINEGQFEQAKQIEKEQIINAMLEEHMFDDSDYANRRYKYWQEVKQKL